MLINLTPHAVNCGAVVIPASGALARVAVSLAPAGEFNGCLLVRGTYGAVTGLPESVEGTLYIVSAMVRIACPDRHDVASPGQLLRDGAGNIVGCASLEVNP